MGIGRAWPQPCMRWAGPLHRRAIGKLRSRRREQSLEISIRIKDLRTQAAATLHEMAIMALRQDKPDQAMELWQKSLDIETRIGPSGMAATLNHMATVAADDAGAEAIYRQSVEVSAASRAYRDLATALEWPRNDKR